MKNHYERPPLTHALSVRLYHSPCPIITALAQGPLSPPPLQFTGSDASRALTTDALLSSHPVEVPIKDPKEIGQVFDALSYQKGACVIRQLEAALGADDFKKVGRGRWGW